MALNERQAIIVVGMHRSGTSAVTRAINLLGADLPGKLLGANVGNKQGHWESEELIALHEEMLAAAGSHWSSVHDIDPSWFGSGSASDFSRSIAEFIEREFARSASFVIKDPRIAVFIPVWKSALASLGIRGRFVVPYRNPLEVAGSLASRDDPDASENVWLERGLLLWLRYVLAAERATRGDLRSFVDFDGLLNDWQGEMGRLGTQLQLQWSIDDPAAEAAIGSFLNKQHKNQSRSEALSDLRNTAPYVHRTFDALGRCAAEPSAEAETFDAVADAWRTGAAVFAGYIRATEARTTAARHMTWELGEARSRILQLEHELHRSQSRAPEVDPAAQKQGGPPASDLARSSMSKLRKGLQVVTPLARTVLREAGVGKAIRFLSGQRTYGVSVTEGADESLDIPILEVERDHRIKQADRLCVVAHIFYGEMAGDVRRCLANIPGNVDVYISTCSDDDERAIRTSFADWPNGKVIVAKVSNRGRDIFHKIVTFKQIYGRYDFVLFVHSKRSPHDSRLSPWRDYLFENLAGSEDVARTNLGLLSRYPHLGIIAPQHFAPLRPWIAWGDVFGSAQRLAARMGFRLEASPLDFPSGSMFWARTAALKPLLDLELSPDDFEEETGQTDNTLAHTIERLFFHICEHAGYSWIKVARPGLLEGNPGVRHEARHRTLRGYLRSRNRKRLLA